MLSEARVRRMLEEAGAVKEGHFLLTSGLHSGTYVEKFELLQRPEFAVPLCAEIARRFDGEGVETVVGPALGGVIIAFEVARLLGVRAIFAEREEGVMKLRRGFTLRAGERVLLVEDVATTGGSVREVISAIEPLSPVLVGVGLLVDRSGGRLDFGVRTEALCTLSIPTYEPEGCPLCAKGVPIVKPGSRKAAPPGP